MLQYLRHFLRNPKAMDLQSFGGSTWWFTILYILCAKSKSS